ncbi:MAG: phosphatase PAP2 family protein [Verrucomicrobiae bacterium]|nr:phosphatase PAP2 family protein [Verrucomicrobiae bacterium]
MIVVFSTLYFLLQHVPFREAVERTPSAIDRVVPFVPSAIYVYLSLWALMPLVSLLQDTRDGVFSYYKTIAFAFVCGFAIFLFWPMSCFRPEPPPGADPVYCFLMRIDRNLNAWPSLHAAFAVIGVAAWPGMEGSARFNGWLRLGLGVWAAAIMLAALLTKQHLCGDVIAGALLGLASHALLRKTNWRQPPNPRMRGNDG